MKQKKLILFLIISFCFICFFISFITNKNSLNKNNNINNTNISYDYNNFKLSSGTNVEVSINLDNNNIYGQAYYNNNSNYDATLYVEGQEIKTIKPYSSDLIVWKKGTFKNSYEFTVTATQGNLDGYFSLAKAEKEEDFQN